MLHRLCSYAQSHCRALPSWIYVNFANVFGCYLLEFTHYDLTSSTLVSVRRNIVIGVIRLVTLSLMQCGNPEVALDALLFQTVSDGNARCLPFYLAPGAARASAYVAFPLTP